MNRISRIPSTVAVLKRYFGLLPCECWTNHPDRFNSVKYWTEEPVAHIMLNRPDELNAIDACMAYELESAIKFANWDSRVRVILLYGSGSAFSSGYDLEYYAAEMTDKSRSMSRKMPWGPAEIFSTNMASSTSAFMEIWRSVKPVVAKIKRVGIGGGSDMSLACDITFIEDNARFGYPPASVWSCPTTVFWFYRLGLERAKRILFTGEVMTGERAVEIGLLGESCPVEELDARVDEFIERMLTVPADKLWQQKQLVNHAVDVIGISLNVTQRLGTTFQLITRPKEELDSNKPSRNGIQGKK